MSDIGTWMHNMGVGWLMASMSESSFMIALVQSAITLPFFLMALPSGTPADIVDRHSYLLYMICWMFLSAASLGALTLTEQVTPWVLQILRFLLGMGNSMIGPDLSASIPFLVSRHELRRPITLTCHLYTLPTPEFADEILSDSGPVMITIKYAVPEENKNELLRLSC